MTNTGTVIRNFRLSAGLSQSQVSKKMRFASPQFLSNIERGLCLLPPFHMKKLAKLIGADPVCLLKAHMVDVYDKTVKQAGF